MPHSETSISPTHGPATKTFFRFVIPSVLSLLAISTASLVDGFFVGNFVGTEALAAVNLLVPFLSLQFGIALMFAVGGSVKAGVSIGKGHYQLASEIFSSIVIFISVLNLLIIPFTLYFSDELFVALGASNDTKAAMFEYFSIICLAMPIQLFGLVIYYFIRADNHPELGMHALILGAACNIGLDMIFIYYFNWGLKGAAWATLIAQLVQAAFIGQYFFSPERHLKLTPLKNAFKQLKSSAFNGFSEFVNEFSIGLVILVFHWIINRQSGTEGIAAFSVINYLIFISLMTYYGIVDAMHGLLSQNFGAGLIHRIKIFMRYAVSLIAALSLLLVTCLYLFKSQAISFFLDAGALQAREMTELYINIIWPLFLFNGFNVLISSYLTAAEKAKQSCSVALSRSLILPISLALLLDIIYSGHAYIYALPLAEGISFVLAVTLFAYYRPSKLPAPAS